MTRARNDFARACGDVGSSFARLRGAATISGVGFFDVLHGQTGVAPNGIELHPVLRFQSSDCARSGAAPPAAPQPAPPAASCNPNYTPCVPNVPYDLDCADIGFTVHVIGVDVYRLDGDGDGLGCE